MLRTSSLRAHYWIEQKVVEDSKHHLTWAKITMTFWGCQKLLLRRK